MKAYSVKNMVLIFKRLNDGAYDYDCGSSFALNIDH